MPSSVSENRFANNVRSYERAQSIVFLKTKEAFGGLSNMAGGFPLRVNGIRIFSSEALYQACRFPYLPDAQRIVLSEPSPMTAKMKIKPYRQNSRPDWNQVRVRIMRWCLRVKLVQNWKAFGELLLATGDKSIVEESYKDDFWGAKPVDQSTLIGMNVLGRLLMELREELKSERRDDLLKVEPIPIPDFLLMGQPIQTVEAFAVDSKRTVAQTSLFDQPMHTAKDQTPLVYANSGISIAGLCAYPDYKDSGLPWLGRVPGHWGLKRGKVLFQKVDRPVRSEDEVITCFRDGVVTLRKNRRLRGFTEAIFELGYQGIRKGDLVIHAMDAFAGAIGVSDSDGKGTPVYAVCQPLLDSNSHYYAHLIREMARTQWIQALSRGIRERSTDFRYETFGRQDLLVPPPDEQAAIARFIDHATRRLDKTIHAKRKIIALLNEQKQAIIHRAVTRGLDPNAPLKDSGIPWLGQIPAHWDTPLNQRIFKEEIRPHGDVPETQLSLSQRDGLIATKDMQERSLQTATFDNWKVTVPGDLVLNRFKAHLGVFFASTLRGIVSFHYGVFAPRRELHSKYFELLFHTHPYRAIYAGRSNGMTVGLQNLSNQNFYNVRCVVPPVSEQIEIVAYAEQETQELNIVISRIEREIELLREYRTRLIADVVTGKLDVREAAARLPAEEAAAPDIAEDEADAELEEAA